jgi:hypothetical protein
MHGYHPSEKQSYAALCTNQEQLPHEISAIPDIFRLMTRDAELANERNSADANAESQGRESGDLLGAPSEIQRAIGT